MSSPSEAASPAPRMRFDLFATRILYVVTFGVASLSAAQGDVWWLLRAGKDIWRTHRVALADSYSSTASGRYWPNHEWLWETTAYALHAVGGMPLLAAWTAATVTATMVVLRSVSKAEGYVVPIVLAAALPLMSLGWTTRPQVTSVLLFALTLHLLARERVWWLPALFLLWANLHAQVVIGGALLVTTLVVAALDHRHRPTTGTNGSRVPRLLLVSGLAAAATLATPLGPRLWTYVLSANSRPGQDRIIEWQSVFVDHTIGTPFLVGLALLAVLAVRRRDRLRSWPARVQLAGVVAMTPLAMLAVRNIPFFVAAAVPLAMTLLEFRTAAPVGLVRRGGAAISAVAAVTAVLVGVVWWASPPRLGWHPVSIPLAQALRACPGHLHNDYDTGAALIWWVPEVKVFVDNRQDPYPAAVIDSLSMLTRTGYRDVFARYSVRCAYVAHGDVLATYLADDGWTRTYAGREGSVWVSSSDPRATSATR